MKRLFTLCVVMSIVTAAMALTAFSNTFKEKYHIKPGSHLGKAGCMVCHVGAKGGKLNAYGRDLKSAMKAASVKKMTPAILTKVEGLDSNGNGKTNLEDIKSDTNPGL